MAFAMSCFCCLILSAEMADRVALVRFYAGGLGFARQFVVLPFVFSKEKTLVFALVRCGVLSSVTVCERLRFLVWMWCYEARALKNE